MVALKNPVPVLLHLASLQVTDEFRQGRVVLHQALEGEGWMPAPFAFVADLTDLLQVAMRVGDERLTLTGFGAGFELVES